MVPDLEPPAAGLVVPVDLVPVLVLAVELALLAPVASFGGVFDDAFLAAPALAVVFLVTALFEALDVPA